MHVTNQPKPWMPDHPVANTSLPLPLLAYSLNTTLPSATGAPVDPAKAKSVEDLQRSPEKVGSHLSSNACCIVELLAHASQRCRPHLLPLVISADLTHDRAPEILREDGRGVRDMRGPLHVQPHQAAGPRQGPHLPHGPHGGAGHTVRHMPAHGQGARAWGYVVW